MEIHPATLTSIRIGVRIFADHGPFITSLFCSSPKNITFALDIALAPRARATSQTQATFLGSEHTIPQ